MMVVDQSIVEWLMTCDPAIRWQVMRDIIGDDEACWTRERDRVETEGWGAQLLAAQGQDGQWDGGAFLPANFDPTEWQDRGQPWTATSFVLTQLRELGLPPGCQAPAERSRSLVGIVDGKPVGSPIGKAKTKNASMAEPWRTPRISGSPLRLLSSD